MNNSTPQQLRLAADIIETGHPFKHFNKDGLASKTPHDDPLRSVYAGLQIRLALATPPDNRPLHNPDNLTAEQVGAGWRLLVVGEKQTQGYQYWTTKQWRLGHVLDEVVDKYNKETTCRLPLSTPWPTFIDPSTRVVSEGIDNLSLTQPVDPYAKLKAAHAAGKVIQVQVSPLVWEDRSAPYWSEHVKCYRIKPDFQLPPPPPGTQWHRTDGWTEEMLPQGYRPLLSDEIVQTTDEFKSFTSKFQVFYAFAGSTPYRPDFSFFRTTRPLTFTHEGKTWTWHRPGDPTPSTGNRKIEALFDDNSSSINVADRWSWDGLCVPIGWRYTETETKTVELGPEDVSPQTCFRVKMDGKHHTQWLRPVSVHKYGVVFATTGITAQNSWRGLMDDYERNDSLSTGLWSPTAWEPCHKPKP